MANTKISALTSATTPLAGTEVLPIVQSGVTVKVANNDLRPKQIQSNATTGVMQIVGPAAAATRVMTIPDANFTAARTDAAQSFTGDQTLSTGNLIPGTAGKGINFTANTGAAGKTSNLFNWYEEGVFTPSLAFGGGSTGLVYNAQNGQYSRVGNTVYFTLFIQIQQVGSSTGLATILNLPFTSANVNSKFYSFSATLQNSILLTGAPYAVLAPNATTITLYQTSASGSANITNANFQTFATNNIIVTGSYQVT